MRVLAPPTELPCPHLAKLHSSWPHHGGSARRPVASLHAGATSLPHRKASSSKKARRKAAAVKASAATQEAPRADSASRISFKVGDHEVVLESGEIGRQANGAVLLTAGETVIYTTACASENSGDGTFLPLTVSYSERFSSAGRVSGGYLKREGRPKDSDILTSRLIDRPIRPLFPKGFCRDTQILSWTLSYDGKHTPEPHAITAASAALLLSDIPLKAAVAGVRVGLTADGFIVNPTVQQMAHSRLDLVMAGTEDKLLMVEGFCDFLTDAQMQEAVHLGMEAVSHSCQALTAWQQSIGKPDLLWQPLIQDPPLSEAHRQLIHDELQQVYAQPRARHERVSAVRTVREDIRASLLGEAPSDELAADEEGEDSGSDTTTSASTSNGDSHAMAPEQFNRAFHQAETDVVRLRATEGRRADGRGPEEVRDIVARAGLLPRTHGSALFTRGETQSLAVATLGTAADAQRVDSMQVQQEAQRFKLQYFFPKSSTGETGRLVGPSRREVGHGNLAERAITPILPRSEEFPYAMRVESTITESNGSSSMASVCSACLALRDAGVPLKRDVAGVAMGLILDGASDSYTILTDILGSEDAMGDMDFKVAGDATGITAFQLDVKAAGIPVRVLDEALSAATRARAHVLERMAQCSPAPRNALGPYTPRILHVAVPLTKVGLVIGSGGKTARSILERSGCTSLEVIDQETGTFEVVGPNTDSILRARDIVLSYLEEPEEGRVYKDCVVTKVERFGVFAEFLPGIDGLVHVSELGGSLEEMNLGDTLDVKLLEVNDGRYKLSRRALQIDANGGEPEAPAPPPPPPVNEGDVFRNVRIIRIESYGLFVDLEAGRQPGLVHISQLAHERIPDPAKLFNIGDNIDVQVMPPRKDGKLALSRKALLPNVR